MDYKEYPKINMEKTGALLKEKVTGQGYTVKDIQKYLQLSCPQPVYRWFRGKVLPSLDHLLMLSRVLKVHMEDLLVIEEDVRDQAEEDICKIIYYDMQKKIGIKEEDPMFSETARRLGTYWRKLDTGVA